MHYNSYVYYDFEEDINLNTNIRLTIGIQFFSKGEKIFSILVGGIKPWEEHCVEEMEGLKNILINIIK